MLGSLERVHKGGFIKKSTQELKREGLYEPHLDSNHFDKNEIPSESEEEVPMKVKPKLTNPSPSDSLLQQIEASDKAEAQ